MLSFSRNVLNYFKNTYKTWLPYVCLTALCFALYLPGIFTIPMDDRDSAHFAQATRQMLETGNYFQIRYQDITRYQKPPGINWLQAISVKLFSTTESNAVWPYRLPSVLSGWLSVLLTFAFVKRLCNRSIAIIASVLLASTILLNVESHLAVIDSSLLSSVVLMQGALWMVYDKSRRGEPISWKWPILFFLSMAYGVLLKGVTPLVGFLTLSTLSIVDKTTVYFKALRWQWGILFLLVFSAAWLTAVSLAEHTNYLMQMLNKDLFPKLAGGHESHGALFGTHLVLLLITFWPVSLFLWPTAVRTWQRRSFPLEKFLLAWIIPIWLFFELMPTKLPQYILPVFPALAVLTAYAIVYRTAQESKVTSVLAIIWGVFSLVLASAFVLIPLSLHLPMLNVAMWTMLILVLTSIISVIFILKRDYPKVVGILILGNLLGFSPSYQWLLPELTPVWTSEAIATAIEKQIPSQIDSQHPLVVVGYAEPSLVFLLGTHAVKFDDLPLAIQDLASKNMPFPKYVLIDIAYKDGFLAEKTAAHLTIELLESMTTFNYNKGHWITLELYKIT